ncbi:hypothetical protein OIDMADRAFT_20062 [Oidiodendron maius Zn]|uniref:Uncharacterized protein n=1 Tax=Oidiodendron maius (strain Zn) TaxID=913774 RepID=A0A0C3CH74_OIDMZ|nr:hypothetical protein OIDMADRAFT_20062 [Oidiodendron maius Zn]
MSLDHSYDYLWSEEMDARKALIYLSPQQEATERPEVGSISMFHQLHCLTSLREALQRAGGGEDIGVDWKDNVHWPHCMQYLRESILCFADPTIERGPIINGTRFRGIDGAHDVRTCRDNSALFQLREQSGLE